MGKNATLPKSKKRDAPKKPVRSSTSETPVHLACVKTPEPSELASLPNGRLSQNGEELSPETVYGLVQEVS